MSLRFGILSRFKSLVHLIIKRWRVLHQLINRRITRFWSHIIQLLLDNSIEVIIIAIDGHSSIAVSFLDLVHHLLFLFGHDRASSLLFWLLSWENLKRLLLAKLLLFESYLFVVVDNVPMVID